MVEVQICSQPPEVARPNLICEVVSEAGRFFEMRPEWDALVQRAGVGHPFLSHTWLRTWWEAFGSGRQLHLITVRSREALVAVAPLMINTVRMYGIRVRRLETFYNFHAPRCGIIVGDYPEESFRMIWEEMSKGSADCDVILLSQILKDSAVASRIESLALTDGWTSGWWEAPPSPYIPLSCEYEKFLKTLTAHYRYNLRKRYERLSRIGPITVERITQKSDVREAMQDGLRIEAAAWKGHHGTAMNSDPNVAEFYIQFAERAADLGWLELTFLRVGEKRIAFDYVLRNGTIYYGVKIGYDPQYHTYSPGNMLLSLILKEACANGATEYDFLGSDDEWKFDWTRETRHHDWLFLFRKRPKPWLVHKIKFRLLPVLKKRRDLSKLGKAVLGLRRAL